MNINRLRKVTFEKSSDIAFQVVTDLNIDKPQNRNMIHWHDHFEMEIIDRGDVIHLVNGCSMHIGAKTLYLITPSDLHTIFPASDDGSDSIDLMRVSFRETAISEALFNDIMHLDSPVQIVLDDDTYAEFRSILNILNKNLERTDSDAKRCQRHLLSYILITVVDLYRSQHSGSDVQNEGVRESVQKNLEHINKAVSYIKYNFRNARLTTKDVANHVYLSTNYFGEIFQQHMRISCLNYIRELRLNFARSLLIQSNMAVAQIAEESGYISNSHFINDFKLEFHTTPKKYRDKNTSQE